jgi:hypothetical protein
VCRRGCRHNSSGCFQAELPGIEPLPAMPGALSAAAATPAPTRAAPSSDQRAAAKQGAARPRGLWRSHLQQHLSTTAAEALKGCSGSPTSAVRLKSSCAQHPVRTVGRTAALSRGRCEYTAESCQQGCKSCRTLRSNALCILQQGPDSSCCAYQCMRAQKANSCIRCALVTIVQHPPVELYHRTP